MKLFYFVLSGETLVLSAGIDSFLIMFNIYFYGPGEGDKRKLENAIKPSMFPRFLLLFSRFIKRDMTYRAC
jgi:hypothetical protein